MTPSGAQFEIVAGGRRATLVEVGGGLRSYARAGYDVLDGDRTEETCAGARGEP